VFDNQCIKLAKLYSKAVDYAKNGIPVDINDNFPKPLIPYKPDWHKAEVTGARELDYYESDRALGYLFRNIDLHELDESFEGLSDTYVEGTAPLEDTVSRAIAPLILQTLNDAVEAPGAENAQTEELYARHVGEMRAVCMTHTLLDSPDVRLTEEEVVLGTILAKSTQPRLRSDRAHRMRLHAETLVRDIRAQIAPTGDQPTEEEVLDGLRKAWETWGWAQHHREKEFIESFSLIALGVILDCLKQLGVLPNLRV
jgi:RNA-dependent RNA polymerase